LCTHPVPFLTVPGVGTSATNPWEGNLFFLSSSLFYFSLEFVFLSGERDDDDDEDDFAGNMPVRAFSTSASSRVLLSSDAREETFSLLYFGREREREIRDDK
jgi:hypothetical protein